MANKTAGYLYILIAAVLWACTGSVAKVAFAEGMHPLEVGFWRAVFGGAVFTAHALVHKQYHLRPRDLFVVIAFAFFCIAVFFASYQVAIDQGGAALASVLLYTAPAWVAILACLFLQEKLTCLRLLSIVLSIIGALVVSFGVGENQQVHVNLLAVVCGVMSGFTYAMTYIFGKKFLRTYPSSTIFMYAVPFALVFMFPFVSFSIPSLKAIVAVVFMGVFSTYGAYFFYYRSLANLDASIVVIVATLEPVLAAAMAFVFWSERFTFLGYLGGALILSGVLLTITEKN